MAENSRTFTSIFDLVDNFTSKFDAIQKRANSISERTFNVGFDFNQSKAGQALDNIQKKVNDTTSTTNSWNNALGRAAGVADKTASSTQKIGNEAQKTTGFLGSMQSKLENVGGVADKLRDKFGAITGLLAGGSIGGMSWLKAMDSKSFSDAVYEKLSRKKVDTKSLEAFVNKANETGGLTTSGNRLRIADDILTRTSLRGGRMEDATTALEKIWYKKGTYLQENYGVRSVDDLSDILTKKRLGPGDKQMLDDLNIRGTGATSRVRSAQKLAAGPEYDVEKLVAEDPYQAFLNKLSDTSKNVGKTMIEPMNMVLGKVNDLLDLINNIPGAPGLIAIIVAMTAAAGGASLLLTVLGPLIPLMTALKVAMFGQAVATAAASTSTSVMAVAGFGGTAANTALAASSTAASGGFWAMAAGIWAAVAPLLVIAVPLIALGAALYLVEQKTHIFSKAFKQLGKTEMAHDLLGFFKDMGYWIREGIKWVDTLYKMLKTTGLSKVVLGAAFGPIGLGLGAASMLSGKDPGELLGWIIDQDKNIIRWIVTTFPFFARIHEILKKVLGVFEWLYSLFQSFWSWIQRAMPGAEKETARQKLEKDISGANNATKGERTLWYDYNDKSFWTKRTDIPNGPTQKLSQGELADLYGEGRAKKFVEKAETYESKPGFAEGIAEAVKKGISGIGTEIANAIKGLVMEIPGMPELAKAITDLQTWLDDHNLGGAVEGVKSAVTTGTGTVAFGAGYPLMTSSYDAASNQLPIIDAVLSTSVKTLAAGPLSGPIESISIIANRNSEGESQPTVDQVAATYVNIQDPAQTLTKKQYDDLDPDQQAGWKAKYATGARFSRGGLFAGIVDTTEEIIPQAVTQRGAGPISRALGLLDSVMSGQPSSMGAGAGAIHIHMPTQDFSGMKISSDVDFKRLVIDANKKTFDDVMKEVKKIVGPGRT